MIRRYALVPSLLAALVLLAASCPREVSAQAIAFSGAVPTPGTAGLLVTSVPLASGDLISELEFEGCAAEVVGLLTQGSWQIYIPGAPAAVNASFPASLAASTPFFVRCSLDSPPALPRPSAAESEFVQMLFDNVFTRPTLEGLRPYMHPDLLASPGIDVQLEYSAALTGPLVGEYYLYDYAREQVPLPTGEIITVSGFAVVGDFEQGKALISLAIVPSGATYRVVSWTSVLLTSGATAPGPGEIDFWTAPVGRCFDDDARLVDCANPHDNEIFEILQHPAAANEPFPGDDALMDFGEAGCVPAFEEYVGIEYELSTTYDIFVIRPTEAAWDEGARRVICALYDLDLQKLTGSARGTAR